jgi:cell division septation protein DedD
MARRRRHNEAEYPAWSWMIFGLAIGLSVALAIYIKDRNPATGVRRVAEPPVKVAAPGTGDNNTGGATKNPGTEKPRFDFYNMLPNFEVVIPEQEADVRVDSAPQAVDKPGLYILQAGSFSEYKDADRRRAELALHGIESQIQRVSIDDKTYHRVRIGPISDLNELNTVRSRLHQAGIDVLRIRLGD